MHRLMLLVTLAAVLTTLGVPAHAQAPSAVVVAVNTGYVPGDDDLPADALTIVRGTDVAFVNAEVVMPAPHSFTSNGCKPNTPEPCRFNSGLVASGGATVVVTAGVAAGTYRFYCTIHPTLMTGTLTVVG